MATSLFASPWLRFVPGNVRCGASQTSTPHYTLLGGTIMGDFLYLYRGGQRNPSPEQSQQIMQKWLAWMKELTVSGNLKDPGQPLELEGKVVKGKAATVTDGPFAE